MRLRVKWIFVSSALALAAGPVWAAGSPPVVRSQDFAATAAGLATGARLRLEGVQIADTGEPATFDLERFEVFAKDAKITVHGDRGDRVLSPPANSYFRGTLKDRPDSRVFLARLADGSTRGMVSAPGETYLIGADSAASEAKALGGPLMMHRVDPVLLKSSRRDTATCGNASLPEGPGNKMLDFGDVTASPALAEKATAAGTTTALYTARIAIETDYEFFQIFNDATVATNYVANLVGFASTVYAAELNTTLVVQSLSLWQTSNDPWTQRNTLCSLLEFGKYWNQNKTGVSRTIAHFLSGKLSGGGISWVGALCRSTFTTGYTSCPELGAETTPWGGDYGYTGNMYGEFNINNPVVVWDIYSFAHEVGHNFGSKHSHCYNNVGGSSEPIDKCYSGESGCYSGATSLPGPSGQGSGTIMSYCNLMSGTYSNISMTFGTNFAYGTLPGREAAQMSNYIGAVAASNSACLAPVSGGGGGTGGGGGGSNPPPPPPPSALPFSDGFESGTMGSWQ
ncbi:MAG TPA: M12 family metallo-peptidase [Thermoanaerobaculia bacterium]